MSARTRNVTGVISLTLLAIVAFPLTHVLTGRSVAAAKAKPPVVNGFERRDDDPHRALKEANRIANRQPNMTYHKIVDIIPVADDGEIGFFADVESWHGAINVPNTPPFMRGMRLRVTVYRPDDPNCQGEPVKVWESPAVELVEGLYQERVPVAIPVQGNTAPYPVIIDLISSGTIWHKPLRSAEEADAPWAYSGKRIAFRVR